MPIFPNGRLEELMPNLYIAEDGTIHDRDVGHCQRVTAYGIPVRVPQVPAREAGKFRKTVFWLITLTAAFLIGYELYITFGTRIFTRISHPGQLSDYIEDFFCMISPFVIVGGSLGCAIYFGLTYADDHCYNLGTYFLSALSAAGGTLGAGLALFLLILLITIIIYLFIGFIIVAFILGILGGD